MSFDAADIAAFNDSDMPGYAVATIAAASVAGRFRERYAQEFGIAGSTPVFEAASAHLTGVAQGTAVTVRAVAYAVAAVEPDVARGMTLLRLTES
jgi:hypothetical protein